MKVTKKEVISQFLSEVMPVIEDYEANSGLKDWPMRRESWNNFVDVLHRDEVITDNQVNNWCQPSFCKPSK